MTSTLQALLAVYRTCALLFAMLRCDRTIWRAACEQQKTLVAYAKDRGMKPTERFRLFFAYPIRCQFWLLRRTPKLAAWRNLSDWWQITREVQRFQTSGKRVHRAIETPLARRLQATCVKQAIAKVLGFSLSNEQAVALTGAPDIAAAVIQLASECEALGLVASGTDTPVPFPPVTQNALFTKSKGHGTPRARGLRIWPQVRSPIAAMIRLQSTRDPLGEVCGGALSNERLASNILQCYEVHGDDMSAFFTRELRIRYSRTAVRAFGGGIPPI